MEERASRKKNKRASLMRAFNEAFKGKDFQSENLQEKNEMKFILPLIPRAALRPRVQYYPDQFLSTSKQYYSVLIILLSPHAQTPVRLASQRPLIGDENVLENAKDVIKYILKTLEIDGKKRKGENE